MKILKITLGDHDLTKQENTEQARKAKDIIIHPNYDDHDYDLAIIKLDKPVKFTKFVIPVCLPSNRNKNFDSNEAKVSGWGWMYESQIIPTAALRKVKIINLSMDHVVNELFTYS